MDAWSAPPLQPHKLRLIANVSRSQIDTFIVLMAAVLKQTYLYRTSCKRTRGAMGLSRRSKLRLLLFLVFSTVLIRTTFSSAFLECEDARSSFSPRVQAAVTGFFSPTDWCQVSFPRSLHAVFVGFISSCISLWNIQSCVLELQ